MITEQTLGIQTAIEWLQDCARETAVSLEDARLEGKVMDLFRSEDVDGLARLMKQSKLEKEFLADLGHFIARWSSRMQSESEA